MGAGIGEGGLDGVGEAAGGGAEVGGALPGGIAGGDAFQQIGGEQPALHDDRCVSHNRRRLVRQLVRQFVRGTST